MVFFFCLASWSHASYLIPIKSDIDLPIAHISLSLIYLSRRNTLCGDHCIFPVFPAYKTGGIWKYQSSGAENKYWI